MSEQKEAKRLGEILIEEKMITEAQLQQALLAQKRDGGLLGRILFTNGFVTQEDVVAALVKQCRIPPLRVRDLDIEPAVIALVSEDMVRKNHVLPVDKLGKILTVAMVDPLDFAVLDQLKEITGLRIKPVVCTYDDLDQAVSHYYGQEGLQEHVEDTSTSETPEPAPDFSVSPEERPAFYPPDSRYTFQKFSMTEENDLALASARSTAESPTGSCSPLFISGPSGSGKTHVLHAISNRACELHPGLRVACMASEGLLKEMASATAQNALGDLETGLRGLDGLLVDDVDLLQSTPEAVRFIGEMILSLVEKGKMVVWTSERPAAELAGLDASWQKMFAGAASLQLTRVPQDLAIKVTRERIREEGLFDVPELVVQLSVVENKGDPKRALEGIRKVVKYASVTEQEITPSLAAEVFRTLKQKEHQREGFQESEEAGGMAEERPLPGDMGTQSEISEAEAKALVMSVRRKIKDALGVGAKDASKALLLQVRNVYKRFEDDFSQKKYSSLSGLARQLDGLVDGALNDAEVRRQAQSLCADLESRFAAWSAGGDPEALKQISQKLQEAKQSLGTDTPASRAMSLLESLFGEMDALEQGEQGNNEELREELSARLQGLQERVLATMPDGEEVLNAVQEAIESGELDRAQGMLDELEKALQAEEAQRAASLRGEARKAIEEVKSSVFAGLFEDGIQDVESLLASISSGSVSSLQGLEEARGKAQDLKEQLSEVEALAKELESAILSLSSRLEALKASGMAEAAPQKTVLDRAKSALSKGDVSQCRDLLSELSGAVDQMEQDAEVLGHVFEQLGARVEVLKEIAAGIDVSLRGNVDIALEACQRALTSQDAGRLTTGVEALEETIRQAQAAQEAQNIRRGDVLEKLNTRVKSLSEEMEDIEILPLTDDEFTHIEQMKMSLEDLSEHLDAAEEEKLQRRLDDLGARVKDLRELIEERLAAEKNAAERALASAKEALLDAMSEGVDVSSFQERLEQAEQVSVSDPAECARMAAEIVQAAKDASEKEKRASASRSQATILKATEHPKTSPEPVDEALQIKKKKLSKYKEAVAEIVDSAVEKELPEGVSEAIRDALGLLEEGSQAKSSEALDGVMTQLDAVIKKAKSLDQLPPSKPSIAPKEPVKAKETAKPQPAPRPVPEKKAPAALMDVGECPTLNPEFTFENYLVGADSKFTCNAARGLSLSPGDVYNPFFIYGMPGVGKTHVLHAIGNAALDVSTEARICCIDWSDLQQRLREAVTQSNTEEMCASYSKFHFLLIDNIEFGDEEEDTPLQEWLCHLLQTAVTEGCQIVMSGLHAPKRTPNMTTELLKFLEDGIVTGLSPLSISDKVEALDQLCHEKNLALSKEILERLAVVLGNVPAAYDQALARFAKYVLGLKEIKDQHVTEEKIREIIEKED